MYNGGMEILKLLNGNFLLIYLFSPTSIKFGTFF